MKTKNKGINPIAIPGKKESLSNRSRKGWHPFGTAIILISVIVAILMAFWFVF